MVDEPLPDPVEEVDISNGLINPNAVGLYANGVMVGHTASDIAIILQRNGINDAVLNISFTTAKSLVGELQKAIKRIEEKTGHEIMTIQYIKEKMEEEDL
ncbi:MAG: hypothetical protein COA73_13645 [Candidatus Hydrogenedentota bacterium]|nr:MAG: hypothetical protein COA73_13645 [Candidatus Hydrogenedentota bacterium]